MRSFSQETCCIYPQSVCMLVAIFYRIMLFQAVKASLDKATAAPVARQQQVEQMLTPTCLSIRHGTPSMGTATVISQTQLVRLSCCGRSGHTMWSPGRSSTGLAGCALVRATPSLSYNSLDLCTANDTSSPGWKPTADLVQAATVAVVLSPRTSYGFI